MSETSREERCVECGQPVLMVGDGGGMGTDTPAGHHEIAERRNCVFCAQRAAWGYVDARRGMPDMGSLDHGRTND